MNRFPPPRALLSLCLCLSIASLSAACDEDMPSPSTLAVPQIMAIKVTPRAVVFGQPHTIEVLSHDVEQSTLEWSACLGPWLAQEEGLVCSTELLEGPDVEGFSAIPLGTGTPLEFSFQEPVIACSVETEESDCFGVTTCVEGTCDLSNLALWLLASDPNRVDGEFDSGTVPTIKRIATGEPIEHPTLTLWSVSSSGSLSALPSRLPIDQTLTIRPVFTDPAGSGELLTTFYATAGEFDNWRTYRGAESTYNPSIDSVPGDTVTLSVVIRDDTGGVNWEQHVMIIDPHSQQAEGTEGARE